MFSLNQNVQTFYSAVPGQLMFSIMLRVLVSITNSCRGSKNWRSFSGQQGAALLVPNSLCMSNIRVVLWVVSTAGVPALPVHHAAGLHSDYR